MEDLRNLIIELRIGIAQLSEMQADTVSALRDFTLTQKQLLTRDEAARYLDITPDNVSNMCMANTLAYSRIGRRIYIAQADILRLAEENRRKSRQELEDAAQSYMSVNTRIKSAR